MKDLLNQIYKDHIVIKYNELIEVTDRHYFVSVANDRVIGLNKCSVEHNEKEKTLTLVPDGY